MNSLKQYFITLFIISFAGILCDFVSGLSGQGAQKALKLVCGLVFLWCIISALFSGMNDAYSFDVPRHMTYEYENAESIIVDRTEKQLEDDLSLAIYEKYGIKPQSINIHLNTKNKDSNTSIGIENAHITFDASANSSSIAEALAFAEQLLGTKITG